MATKNFKNNNASLTLDTGVGHQYDKKELHQYDRRVECGRSMVEMLGTLAIIGVLSIGGIAGYSYGMDKYRANEALKDVNLRVIDLLTQASQGRPALSLAEWENEDSIYDFANPTYVEGENLIAFDVGTTKKLPKSVCQMVFDGLANTAVQIDINAVHSNSNDNCGEDNTLTLYFEGGGSGTTNTGGETPTDEQCGETVCGTCQKCENESCVTVGDYEQKCTTDDNKTGWCVSGACEPETCNCGPNQYCVDKNSSCTQPNPSGTCKDLDFRTVEIDGTTYYISTADMSWWDAASFCKALGKNMINHEPFTEKCSSPDDVGCSSTGEKLSPLGEKLEKQASYLYWVWSNALLNSCSAHFLASYSGCIWDASRNDVSSFKAICK